MGLGGVYHHAARVKTQLPGGGFAELIDLFPRYDAQVECHKTDSTVVALDDHSLGVEWVFDEACNSVDTNGACQLDLALRRDFHRGSTNPNHGSRDRYAFIKLSGSSEESREEARDGRHRHGRRIGESARDTFIPPA